MQTASCYLCGADDSVRLFEEFEHIAGPIVKCKECGLVYVNPIKNIDIPAFYQMNLPESERAQREQNPVINLEYLSEREWKKKDFDRRLAQIETLKPTGRLLDVGCHLGFFLEIASEKGFETYGVEPNVSTSACARNELGLDVTTGTLRQIAFPSSYFDIVTMFHVLEHLQEPFEELLEIKRVLKDDGLLVVEVPRFNSWSRRLLGKRWRSFEIDHLAYFTDETLLRMLEKAGFQVIGVNYPGRYMSLRYLTSKLKRISNPLHTFARQAVETLHLDTITLHLNLGDIMSMYATVAD